MKSTIQLIAVAILTITLFFIAACFGVEIIQYIRAHSTETIMVVLLTLLSLRLLYKLRKH